MGSSFYVSADREDGAEWTFTDDELSACVTRLWPGSRITHADSGGILEMSVQQGGQVHPFAWQTGHRVLTYPDQEPLDGADRIVRRLLRALAPGVRAVRWADHDATPEPVDLR
ncbi:hypothetical protein QR77_25785 [Streptomyces sp. 150FB]|uniref:hypothetical protein n=1 Tax=Streptomyces sp. 150FB TaxID=1576605 RepID=UPI0005890C87|nr:hypothetical protein [Streptomyces sp. 150FB]KIF76371.1 hypothetical protein QR77_25785 [Streptomyces sp. 150FB]